jgi:hypothetical protein
MVEKIKYMLEAGATVKEIQDWYGFDESVILKVKSEVSAEVERQKEIERIMSTPSAEYMQFVKEEEKVEKYLAQIEKMINSVPSDKSEYFAMKLAELSQKATLKGLEYGRDWEGHAEKRKKILDTLL